MIITICGSSGSGKSSVAKLLAKKLGYRHYSVGDFRRAKAKERGMTLAEYNILGERDPSTDMEADEYQKELGEKEDNFVIDGRTGFHFIPHSFKVFIDAPVEIRAKRIFGDSRGVEEKTNNIAETLALINQREESDKLRYKKYYGINHFDKSNYDLIVDSGSMNVEECVEFIIEAIRK